jgi:hypothetical protein
MKLPRILGFAGADFGEGMFVKEVGHEAVPLLGIEHQASDEVV